MADAMPSIACPTWGRAPLTVAGWLLAWLLLAACVQDPSSLDEPDGGSFDGGVTLDAGLDWDWIPDLAGAHCAALAVCNPRAFSRRFSQDWSCARFWSDRLYARVSFLAGVAADLGREPVDRLGIRECIDNYLAGGCGAASYWPCASAWFRGSGEEGSRCADDAQCSRGMACVSEQADSACGRCVLTGRLGEACDASAPCDPASHLGCVDGACVPVDLPEGTRCSKGETYCAPGLYCHGEGQAQEGTCLRWAPVGAECPLGSDVSCGDWGACRDSVCVAYRFGELGEACGGDWISLCANGARCDAGICVPRPTRGESCSADGCRPGLFCGAEERCVDLGGPESPCRSTDECQPGLVCDGHVSGTCRSLPAVCP